MFLIEATEAASLYDCTPSLDVTDTPDVETDPEPFDRDRVAIADPSETHSRCTLAF